MKRILTWAAYLLALIVVLALLVAGAGYAVLSNTVPSPSGRLAIPGLSAAVEVVRDKEGVPHIFAQSMEDLIAALGFVHAQDRLWQMELNRRAGQGRLSEIFGERTFRNDVFLRTLDLYGHAERSLAALEPPARGLVEAYARGINAYLERPTRWFEPRLPPEFLLLGHTPEPWRAADTLVTVKMMALNLSTNLNHEMRRLELAAQGLTAAEIEDVMPTEADAPPLPELSRLYPLKHSAPRHRAAEWGAEGLLGGGASNNWVVAGSKTLSGKPLLGNDPHLPLVAPATWYLAHLALERPGAERLNVVGATLAGTPLVVLGRAEHIAWGFTNTGADVEDVFIEKLNPDNAREYLTPEGWKPFHFEPMAISVRGSGVRRLERRRTRHGPVLPGFYRNLDGLLAEGYVAALQWVALSDDDTTIAAGLYDPDVRTVAAYFERMRRYVVPMQNMVVADTAGNIGLIAPGRVPVRQEANKVMGRAPVPGWDASYDWKGFIGFEDLPQAINPPAGAIGTANAPLAVRYSGFLTYDWDAPFRQQRIDELIVNRGNHDMASMRAAQADVLSLADVRLKSLLIAAARRSAMAETAVLDRLAAWDAGMRAQAVEPLIFVAWVRETVKAIYRDDLGDAFDRFFDMRAPSLIRLLEGRAKGRDWCDDASTPQRETCPEVIGGALAAALKDLEKRYGADRRGWQWGRAHVALSENQVLGQLPVIGPLFNVQVPSAGGNYTLNRGMVDFREQRPFANRNASSYRAIYDLSDLDRSLFMQTTGQSGNPFSPLYRSFAERWAKVEYIEIATRRSAIERAATGKWQLTPAAALPLRDRP
jgi:penicillin amidase